jgi:hypothetical protein
MSGVLGGLEENLGTCREAMRLHGAQVHGGHIQS